MRIGVTFPQTEIGTDPAVIRDYAQTAEGLGYDHILVFDHVLGASTANRPGVKGPMPVWIGGMSEAVLERAGKMGDGWFPQRSPDDQMAAMLDRLRGYARAAGRDETQIGIEGRLSIGNVPEGEWARQAE